MLFLIFKNGFCSSIVFQRRSISGLTWLIFILPVDLWYNLCKQSVDVLGNVDGFFSPPQGMLTRWVPLHLCDGVHDSHHPQGLRYNHVASLAPGSKLGTYQNSCQRGLSDDYALSNTEKGLGTRISQYRNL